MRFFDPSVGERTEWARRLDCAKQGCNPPHGDDGELSSADGPMDHPTINGHAATLVYRVVVLPPWQEHEQT